jgi:glycosyltransferase involved in cell wall biosynthesis
VPSSDPPPLVLHVCAVDFTAWHFIRPLLHALRGAGVARVGVACGGGDWFDRLAREGFVMHEIAVVRRLGAPAAHWRAAGELRALFARERPTLVHTHTPIAGWLGRRAARRAGVPHIFHTVHGQIFHDRMAALPRLAAVAAERIAAPWCDAQLFVSREDRDHASSLNWDRWGASLVYVGNGVDLNEAPPATPPAGAERRELRRGLGLPEDAWIVGTMGRLVRSKGIGELLAAGRFGAERCARAPRADRRRPRD